MAKHLYSPRISDVWKEVESLLGEEESLTPKMQRVLANVMSILEERDQALEDALLGDLVVNDVAGTVGTVPTTTAKQIGWSANFGSPSVTLVDSGHGDGTQDAFVAYGNPFVTDTTVLLITPVLIPGSTSFVLFLRSSDKTGFTVTAFSGTPGMPAPPTPMLLSYVAIGF